MNWKESVVVLTGASSGIGAALATELGRRGARVGLIARRDEELRAVAASVEGVGGKAAVSVADVGDREGLRASITSIARELGPPTHLVANAGVGVFTPAKRLDAALVERVMRVNFLGLVYAVEAVLPGMLERRAGHIVGVSSLAGWRGFPKTSAYAASKAAMTSWLEGLRIELAHQGVRVTTVHPGFVRTPMTAPNPFRMPFLMEADVAARIIARGVERGRSEVNFPFPTAGFMHVMRRMPNFVYDLLMRKGM